MTTINLHQDQQQKQPLFSEKASNRGLIFSIGILIVTFLAWGGLNFYLPKLIANNAKLDAQINQDNAKIVELKNLELTIDMRNRLKEIKNNLGINDKNMVTTLDVSKVLNDLSGDLNVGVVVSKFEYKGDGTVIVSFDSTNYSDVAKQIASFKRSDNFSEVVFGSVTRNEKYIGTTVSMKVVKQS